ncbi:MAG TPA: glycosyltransferase [Sphingomicrobium sp.]|jgi:alpha-1,6-mannosyltransferase|nr:glycosyltransferase [Sphingomicrobium sp.]
MAQSSGALLFCDLTQSWSEFGGGVGTYLRRKRDHILSHTPHRHLLIVPGATDTVQEKGRAITVTIASPPVPSSPNYRLLLRNGAVRKALERFRPDLVDCQDGYNLPWAALSYRKRHPSVAVTAVYMTDFPTAYVHRPLKPIIGDAVAKQLRALAYRYCGYLYRRFDTVMALGKHGGAAKLRQLGVKTVEIVPLGVEIDEFNPSNRDPELRRSLGVADNEPLLIYVGRLDRERRAEIVVDAFRRLPRELGARLVLVGEGPVRDSIVESGDDRVIAPGYLSDRAELARWLASADMYVSAMADETFGVSVIEAQASGLPVVGVAAGGMLDRVDRETGRLGPVDDCKAMAANILDVWNSDRSAMAVAAREHVEGRFSWDRTFQTLFGDVYPRAIAARADLQAGVAGTFAGSPAT